MQCGSVLVYPLLPHMDYQGTARLRGTVRTKETAFSG